MKKIISFIIMLVVCFSVAMPVLAEGTFGQAMDNLGKSGKAAGAPTEKSVPQLVGSIIQFALTMVGTIFLILMVYAGYLWMTARGAEEQVTKARDIIINCVIGLVVVMSAYAITYFVTSKLGQ